MPDENTGEAQMEPWGTRGSADKDMVWSEQEPGGGGNGNGMVRSDWSAWPVGHGIDDGGMMESMEGGPAKSDRMDFNKDTPRGGLPSSQRCSRSRNWTLRTRA